MVNKEDLKYPFIILFCLFLLVIFHVWFSSHVEEEHWKRPTPIPDSLDNIYNWPPNVNYLGTPIPDNQVMDPFMTSGKSKIGINNNSYIYLKKRPK